MHPDRMLDVQELEIIQERHGTAHQTRAHALTSVEAGVMLQWQHV